MSELRPPASRLWVDESNVIGDGEVAHMDRWRDPACGARVLRLTTAPYISHHIYPEAPISTPDGKRFIFRRTRPWTGESHCWIADLPTRRIRQVTDEPGASHPIMPHDGKAWFYSVGRSIVRMDPETFERQTVFERDDMPGKVGAICDVSWSGTKFIAGYRGDKAGENGVVGIDIEKQTTQVMFTQPDCLNPHAQYCRGPHDLVMVQVNDGIAFDEDNNRLRLVGENGASLWVGSDDGTGWRKLPVGSQPLERVQGHQCWVGDQPRVITTLHRRDAVDQPWRQDRIVALGVDDPQAKVIAEGPGFTHMHTSRDGRWWISDCNRTASVFVGALEANTQQEVIRTGATFGAQQVTHPHPFFISSDGWIGWNSDVTGWPHIYVAKLTIGLADNRVTISG